MTNFHLYLIQLWWQFFQMFVYGDARSLCSNLAGIDYEKLYGATFICQYGLCCCIVWPSLRFDCFLKIWATCKKFLGKWSTTPGRKLPVRLCIKHFCRWNLSPKECFDLQKDRQNSQNNELPSSLQWSFDGKSSPARISSHLLNGTFLSLLFSCLKNWSWLNIVWQTMNKGVSPSWTKYDTAPQHLLSLTIDVVLPGNLQIHLDVTLDDVNWASASLCYLRATIL